MKGEKCHRERKTTPLIAEFKRRSRAARKQLLRKTERRIQSVTRPKAR